MASPIRSWRWWRWSRSALVVAGVGVGVATLGCGSDSSGPPGDAGTDTPKDTAVPRDTADTKDAFLCGDLGSGCSGAGVYCPVDFPEAKTPPAVWCKKGYQGVFASTVACGGYNAIVIQYSPYNAHLLLFNVTTANLIALMIDVPPNPVCVGADETYRPLPASCTHEAFKLGPDLCAKPDTGGDG